MAEHPAVNRVVVGSSPTWGARIRSQMTSDFLYLRRQADRLGGTPQPSLYGFIGLSNGMCRNNDPITESLYKTGIDKHGCPEKTMQN